MRNNPLISVCMVTYNHEKYVGDAIRSVLTQTFSDFELVIVNDGSTDGTAGVIAGFDDPRIVVIHQPNQGPGAATNRAIAAARGKYVASFSGDDLCHADRLEKQYAEYQRGGPRVLFGCNDFIDDDGEPIAMEHFANDSFRDALLTRAQTLARLFLRGNFLNGVTVFTERGIVGQAPYDPTLLQLQDFDVWVRLIARYDLHVMPDHLISYRIRRGGANLSAPDTDTILRSANEHYLILRHFFDGVSPELFREAFAEQMIRPDANGALEYACEQAFLYTKLPWAMGRLIGTERLQSLLSNPASADVLAKKYNYAAPQYFELLRTVDALNLFGGPCSSLFFDTGAGWTATQEIRRPIQTGVRDFKLTFKLPPNQGLRAVRWDPVENQLSRVRITAIDERDVSGRVRPIDLILLEHNGRTLPDGTVEFDTFDPSFWWPVRERTHGLTIHGTWEFDYVPQMMNELRAENKRLREDLAEARSSRTLRLASGAWQQTRKVFKRLKAS